MKNLLQEIDITIDNNQLMVSAKKIYDYLGIKESFTNWINKEVTSKYIEGVDFITCNLITGQLYDYSLKVSTTKIIISELLEVEKVKNDILFHEDCLSMLQKGMPSTYIESLTILFNHERNTYEYEKTLSKILIAFDTLSLWEVAIKAHNDK